MNAPDVAIEITDRQLAALGKNIKLDEVRSALEGLRNLCSCKISAAQSFADACKLVAIKANVSPAVLSAFVTAIERDSIEQNQEKAEQLALLFDEVRP